MNIVKDIALPILKLALPLILIQLCQASLGLMNALIAGRYHYMDLAAIGLGNSIWGPVFVLMSGSLYVLVPKFSAFKQQQDSVMASQLFKQARQMALFLSICSFALLHLLAWLCPRWMADLELAMICKDYLHYVAFAIPGLVYLVFFRYVCEGHSILKPIMLTYVLLLLCDSAISFMLVNGIGLLPEMGGAGAGLATAISAYIACFAMHYFVQRSLPEIRVQKTTENINFFNSLNLLKQGLPIGTTLVLQIMALSTLAFFAAKLGSQTIAAHQIVINIALVIIMIPVAISHATTIRIAGFFAMQNQQAQRLTTQIVAIFTLIYVSIMASILTLAAHFIISLFSNDSVVVQVASQLMPLAAVFLIFDALQTVASGVLRGLQKFLQPLCVILFCYWILIIPLSYIMGVNAWMQPKENVEIIWKIMSIGMSLAAILLILQSYRMLYKGNYLTILK